MPSLLFAFPFDVLAWTLPVEVMPFDAFDVFIATRFIEFFIVIASGGDAESDNCLVELSDDNDDDESERSEVEPPL